MYYPMNQTIKERLILFVKHLGMAQTRFEKHCGLANGYINNIRKSISPDKLELIALCFPELNTGWLMTGEGEMIKSTETPESQLSAKAEGLIDKLVASMEAAMASMQTTIETQKQIIDTQRTEIERLQRTLLEREAVSLSNSKSQPCL